MWIVKWDAFNNSCARLRASYVWEAQKSWFPSTKASMHGQAHVMKLSSFEYDIFVGRITLNE